MLIDFDDVEQIFGEELKDEKYFILLFESFLDVDYVFTLQHLQHPDLSLDVLSRYFVIVPFLELLYGHQVPHLLIHGFPDDSIRTLVNHVHNLILVHLQ